MLRNRNKNGHKLHALLLETNQDGDATERARIAVWNIKSPLFFTAFWRLRSERPIHATLWQSERSLMTIHSLACRHRRPYIADGERPEPRGPHSLEKHNLFGVLGQKQPTKRFSLPRPPNIQSRKQLSFQNLSAVFCPHKFPRSVGRTVRRVGWNRAQQEALNSLLISPEVERRERFCLSV